MPKKTRRDQATGDLFDAGGRGKGVEPAAPPPETAALASALPPEIRLGTSSWSFRGWSGLVYARDYPEARLSKEGLAAYARHPLFRTVGLDRTHYAPIDAAQFQAYAAQVGDDFRFLVKAHEACTLFRYPDHPRYGQRKGQQNDRFLEPAYAARHVVEPAILGLGQKLGPILFQFAPQNLKPIGGAAALHDRLHAFLTALPALPPGACYAVEVRNKELLGERFAALLSAARAAPCLTSLARMPELAAQAERSGAAGAPALIARWMVHRGETYESALEHYAPFDKLVDEDPQTRDALAGLALEAAARSQPVYVVVNNKAEGSSPLSVAKLAAAIHAGRAERAGGPDSAALPF